MKIDKVYYNHRFAQPTSDTAAKIEQENQDFETLLSEATKYKTEYGNDARNLFMAEFSREYENLSAAHIKAIDKILPGKPSASSVNGSGLSDSSFNNSKNKAKSYEPYLQKINESPNGNNLLYLAAVSSFGFPSEKDKNVDYLYTESNKNRIIQRLNEITSNHYIQTKFPNISNQLSDAISRLDNKIKKTSQDPPSAASSAASSDTVPAPGSGNPVINPYPKPEIGKVPGEQPTSFDPDKENFSNEARTILEQIEKLEIIADSDTEKFKEQWTDLYENILNQLEIATSDNKINIPESSDIKAKLKNLDNKWVGIFYPGGFKRVGTGTIIPLDVRDAKAELLEQIKINKDAKQVTKLANIFQKAFLNKQSPQKTELYSYLKEINNAITVRNGNDRFEENIPLISMSEYR